MHHRRILLLILLALMLTGTASARQSAEPVTVTILNTADEHGWLLPFTPFGSDETLGGAAVIYALWRENEAYDPATHLLLSSGDNWTGPAISTWFAGAPMVEAFNAMGYRASAIGNHEFDFGIDTMRLRFDESDAIYLAANIRDAETGAVADFTQPYALFEVNGVQVGVVGLATLATPTTTNPRNLTGLAFTPYEDALREFVPEMRAQGARVIVALTHVCMGELAELARAAEGLVDAMFAGHCNETGARTVAGTTILGSGTAWRSYARLTLAVDAETGAIVESDAAVIDVAYPLDDPPVTPDPDIAALVARWEAAVNAELDQPVAYTTESIARQSATMLNLVTDAWLWAYPAADMAVTNTGGFRQDLPAGTLTRGDIVGMLPFDNTLIAVNVTGAQLLENLMCCGGAIAGLTVDGDAATLADGTPLVPDATYTVLINDFMYFGGDGYLFGEQDPDGYDTGIHWRQPVFDYLLSLETRADNPLEDWLDMTDRLR